MRIKRCCIALIQGEYITQVALEIVPDALTGLERPEGVLSVDLIEAINVPKADLFKWSDPYVV